LTAYLVMFVNMTINRPVCLEFLYIEKRSYNQLGGYSTTLFQPHALQTRSICTEQADISKAIVLSRRTPTDQGRSRKLK
jgi:hypothetical protein